MNIPSRPTAQRAAKQNTDSGQTPSGAAPAMVVKTHRRPGLIAAGVALIVLSALAGWWLVSHAANTQSVVSVRVTVPAGQQIRAEDLGTTQVNVGSGLNTVPADQIGDLVGKRASVDLVAGTTVPADALTEQGVPAEGQSVIGILATASTAPVDQIHPGDTVRLVTLPDGTTGSGNGATSEEPAATGSDPVTGTVVSVTPATDGTGTTVAVAVPGGQAPGLQTAAAQSRVGIIVDPREH